MMLSDVHVNSTDPDLVTDDLDIIRVLVILAR